jgi:hypothetical protein
MLSGAEIGAALAVAQTSDILLKQLNVVSEKLKPFKPDVKSFRIDYMNRNSEVKYLLLIPTGVRRLIQRKIEIPSITGFKFYEMWDLDKMELVNSSWTFDGKNWLLDVTKLPSSEKYWLTVRGQISKSFLDQLVSVKVAENPSRVKENDHYWIHSALTNVEQFDKIWTALNMEQVNADIRIGVERMFSATIPQGLKDRLELQQKLLNAITRGDREEKTRLEFRYRTSPPTVTPMHLNEILGNLVSPETFTEYVTVEEPFTVNNIEPIKEAGMFVPEKVKVQVQTDLNYDVPTAKGDLCFYRHKYSQFVAEKVKSALKKEKES